MLPGSMIDPLLASPQAADVAADVAAGPAVDIDRGRRRRLIDWRRPRQIGRQGRNCEDGESNCRKENSSSSVNPCCESRDPLLLSEPNLVCGASATVVEIQIRDGEVKSHLCFSPRSRRRPPAGEFVRDRELSSVERTHQPD